MSVLIEFVKDTEKRSKGDKLLVDDRSAKSFVETKKVAKVVDDAPDAVVEMKPNQPATTDIVRE